eukprot:gene9251-6504_t
MVFYELPFSLTSFILIACYYYFVHYYSSYRYLLLLRRSSIALLRASKMKQYEQEAFESHRQFIESTTYPGAIRESTPGDTSFYIGAAETILHANERHYWRAVVDDPQLEYLIPLRIRFKVNVWVTAGWEQRMHVLQVMAPRHITVENLIERIKVENQSPYLAELPFVLLMDGMQLDENKDLEHYGITENSQIDAVDSSDFVLGHESPRPKDWNIDEITDEDLLRSPYKEMGMKPQLQLTPRYEQIMQMNCGTKKKSKKHGAWRSFLTFLCIMELYLRLSFCFAFSTIPTNGSVDFLWMFGHL